MMLQIFCAILFLLILSACGAIDYYIPARDLRTQTAFKCSFFMTKNSAKEAANTLEITYVEDREFAEAVATAICNEVLAGNDGKTIEIRLKDRRGFVREITFERE